MATTKQKQNKQQKKKLKKKQEKKVTVGRKTTPRAAALPSTGNVHLYVGISLDGYIADPDGGVDWLNPYGDARAGFTPFIKTISAFIMGRTTYDHAVEKHGAGESGFGGMASYVVTHRPFRPTAKDAIAFVVPRDGDLKDLIAMMREKHPGGDFWLMGGGSLTKSFLEADLIDILSVAFVPTLIGAGLPMFPQSEFRERRLALTRQHTYPSGVVELRYERVKTPR
jgi:dihydrofolate reductase